jgi:hypothetical protein
MIARQCIKTPCIINQMTIDVIKHNQSYDYIGPYCVDKLYGNDWARQLPSTEMLGPHYSPQRFQFGAQLTYHA